MISLIIESDNGSIDLYHDEDIYAEDIKGLGVERNVRYSEMYGSDGALYNGSNAGVRRVSVLIRFYNKDVDAARIRLNYLLQAENVKVRYVTEHRDLYVVGTLENLDIDTMAFPVVGQINLVCTDPYWRDSNSRTVVIAGTELCWRFPFTIPDKGMMFERTRSALITPVYNNGSVESGAIFTLKAVTACTNPKLLHVDTGEYIQVTLDMVAGDVLEICTKFDEKSIYFTHEGERIDYYNYRVYGSTFFQLRTGKNNIKYTVDSGDQHALEIMCDFDTKFGGI